MPIRNYRRRSNPEPPVRKSKWNRNHEWLARVMRVFPGGTPKQYQEACGISDKVFEKCWTQDFRDAFGLEDRLGIDPEKALVKNRSELTKQKLGAGSKVEMVMSLDREIVRQQQEEGETEEDARKKGLLYWYAKWVRQDPGTARHAVDQLIGRPDAKFEVKIENETMMQILGQVAGEQLGSNALPFLMEVQRRVQMVADPPMEAEFVEHE
jgi:hypothetical protein